VRNVRPIEDRNAIVRQLRKTQRRENEALLETIAEKLRSNEGEEEDARPEDQGHGLENSRCHSL
jgi:hypothetical protein